MNCSAQLARSSGMEMQLLTGSVPEKIPLTAPEQDYLTRYFGEGWYCLSIQWNYQLHQLAYCRRTGASESVRVNIDYEKDIHIVHCSGKVQPPHWMFDTASPRRTYKEFVNTTMVDQFLTVLEHTSFGLRASRHKQSKKGTTFVEN